jgi:ribosome assembly protein RRB1
LRIEITKLPKAEKVKTKEELPTCKQNPTEKTYPRSVDYLLASGSDSGEFSIWDLRQFTGKPTPAASFKWHQKPVTSIDWHPTDSSVLAVAGADDQTTIWDLSLEQDAEETPVVIGDVAVPPQLLFVHQGQSNVKEVAWHRQRDGVLVTTAFDGFNLFKTFNQ